MKANLQQNAYKKKLFLNKVLSALIMTFFRKKSENFESGKKHDEETEQCVKQMLTPKAADAVKIRLKKIIGILL